MAKPFLAISLAGWMVGLACSATPSLGGYEFAFAAQAAPAQAALAPAEPAPDEAAPDQPGPDQPAPLPPRQAFLIQIPLPIVDSVDMRVRRKIEALLERTEAGQAERPLLILEFHSDDGRQGAGSQFERCLSLARFLANLQVGSRLRTVAFLPQSLQGHAVLVAMAAEELIVADSMQFGPAVVASANAGRADGDQHVDSTVREGYREIANRRRTVAELVALALVDESLEVYRLETQDGARFVDREQLDQARSKATIVSVDTITTAGQLAQIRGVDLRKFGIASYLASDRLRLKELLKIGHLEEDLARDGKWRAALVELHGRLSPVDLQSRLRSLQDRLDQNADNLLIVSLDSPGGAPVESAQWAGYLGEIQANQVRTVAVVGAEARADAWLIAFACDYIYLRPDSVVGGPGAPSLTQAQRDSMVALARQLAAAKGRDWSLAAALLDPNLSVSLYRSQPGRAPRVWTEAERAEQDHPEAWTRAEPLRADDGLTGDIAVQYRLARQAAALSEVLEQLGVASGDLTPLQNSWTVSQIERLAAQPWLAQALLFFAFFALMSELSAPGLGVAGFVSAVCFILFFWIQFLAGTAGWLELLLFLGGVTFVVIEIFVTPGVGVFGFGGGAMMLLALVLSSQTFVIPTNSYQVNQLPRSVFSLVAGLSGGLAALLLMRKYLPNTPFFRRLMLPPPTPSQAAGESARDPYDYLKNKRGVAVTRLTPSGKARFGDSLVDVISTGELVAPGTPVVVTEVLGAHIRVRSLES